MNLNKYDTIYIIADTHLNKNKIEVNNKFLKLLNKVSKTDNSCLIINGDFIDFWFENLFYDLSEEYPILQKIKNFIFENNYPVFLIKGNRDFIADKKFENCSGIKVIGDEIILNYNNKKYYITHGDIFCTNDISYQIWRWFSRSIFMKYFTLLIPKFIGLMIIRKIRQMSYIKNLRERRLSMSIVIDEVEKKAEQLNADYIICGHNHTMRFKNLIINSEQKKLIVLHKLNKYGTYIYKINKNKIDKLEILK